MESWRVVYIYPDGVKASLRGLSLSAAISIAQRCIAKGARATVEME